jgi:hypothetical protein
LTFDESFQVVNQYQGRAASDPGHFALALKPLTTALTSSDFFIARTDALQRYCALSAAEAGTPGSLGALVSAAAACYGERIVYSPLVQGETAGGLLDGGVGLASFFSNPGNLLRIQSLIGSRAFGAARFLLEGSSYM